MFKFKLPPFVPGWAWFGMVTTPLALIITFALISLNDAAKSLAVVDLYSSAKKGGLVNLADPLFTLQTAFKGEIPISLIYAPLVAVGIFNIVLILAIFRKSWVSIPTKV